MRKVILFFAASLSLSVSAAQPKDSINGQMYRLFTPLTFYHSVVGQQFSLDGSESSNDPVAQEVERTLLNVYLNRPDLVSVTETEM